METADAECPSPCRQTWQSALLCPNEAFDRPGCGALEVVEPHPGRGDHDAHHRVVERAHLLLEPGVLIFWHRPERRFKVFVGDAILLPQLGGSPDK